MDIRFLILALARLIERLVGIPSPHFGWLLPHSPQAHALSALLDGQGIDAF